MAEQTARGLAHLADRLQDAESRDVTYKVGTDEIAVKATCGRKLLRVVDEDTGEMKLLTAERDYILAVDQLEIASVAFEPALGHKIIDDNDPDGVTRTWEVSPPGPGEQPWQWIGNQRILARLFTKQVA